MGNVQPWLEDADVRLYHGDVLQVLRELPAESVDCCVTSPPYWGLRDYGTGAWDGGDEGCDHKIRTPETREKMVASSGLQGGKPLENVISGYASECARCGATRIDQQLGLEPTPEEYVTRMVEVFREVRRVLAAHGTVWLNLGDSYASDFKGSGGQSQSLLFNDSPNGPSPRRTNNDGRTPGQHFTPVRSQHGLKPKDLVGIPWRVAFALQADGWYLRSDIIWAKPNPMPESVTDRPTKAHEYVFLLSKQPRYFFDQEAVREQSAPWNSSVGFNANGQALRNIEGRIGNRADVEQSGRNIRSVWEIATQPYPEAHFATFPEELARRCIAAGTSERGKCPECGAPWVREVESESHSKSTRDWRDRWPATTPGHNTVQNQGVTVRTTTLGWRVSCDCELGGAGAVTPSEVDPSAAVAPRVSPPAVPCVVLDPFIGSGTVAHVARKLGRHAVGIDLNESYLKLAARRLQQQSLFADTPAG